MEIAAALAGVSRILLDTAPVIYLLEGSPLFGERARRLFRLCALRGIVYVTTPITLAECLVRLLLQGARETAILYEETLLSGEQIDFCPIDSETVREAARIRAEFGLQLADAFQVAVALKSGCDALLTNDSALSRVTGLRILQISEIEI